jgi:hypothetical protein
LREGGHMELEIRRGANGVARGTWPSGVGGEHSRLTVRLWHTVRAEKYLHIG